MAKDSYNIKICKSIRTILIKKRYEPYDNKTILKVLKMFSDKMFLAIANGYTINISNQLTLLISLKYDVLYHSSNVDYSYYIRLITQPRLVFYISVYTPNTNNTTIMDYKPKLFRTNYMKLHDILTHKMLADKLTRGFQRL